MDVIVGATILIALVILIMGVLWLKEALVTGKHVSYTVLFPNVGTLQVGDPVMVNGVTKGRVLAMNLRNDKVATAISLEKNVVLTDSCRVVVQNIGLMGERGIGIMLTRSGAPFGPTHKKDTTFLTGYFDTGIAEAMGMMGTVLSGVEVLMNNVTAIMNSTVADTVFLRLFQMLVKRLDTLSKVSENLVVRNGPLVDLSVKNLSYASSQLKELLDNNSGHLSAILANGDALSSYSLTLAAKVDSLTTSIQGVVREIKNGRGALGMMMKDDQFADNLRRTLADVDTLVNDVRSDGLKLRARLGFGKKKQ
jgi:phospholipid/cholesterol/gamma-HCH transport system substrate-binding protein